MTLVQNYLTKNPCYKANVNKADSRYTTFQQRGPLGLMLHSVGCAQPSAQVFLNSWNQESYDYSCVHGVIDANTGVAYQCLPWNYRGWHGGGSSNNTHVGVEMCESKYIRYLQVGESGYAPGKFIVTDAAKAKADCKRCYDSAVELYAMLCKEWGLNPLTDIVSHYEGGQQGIASGHGDPEHYWNGLGIGYTMNGFRAAVKAKLDQLNAPAPEPAPTPDIEALVEQKVNEKLTAIAASLAADYDASITAALNQINSTLDAVVSGAIDKRIGTDIVHLEDIKSKAVRADIKKLLDAGVIDGGTDAATDSSDIRMPYQLVRVMAVNARYADKLKEEQA